MICWAAIIHDTKNAIFQWFEEVYDCVCQIPNQYEFLSIYRQANGRYIDMKTDLDMPPLVNGPCNLVASPSTRCTLTPDSAIAEQGSSDSSPHGDSCLT